MNDQKLNVAILFGGQSTEHDVSILSARNIVSALDRNQYQINAVYVTEQGEWYYVDETCPWLQQHPQSLITAGAGQQLLLMPGRVQQPFVFADNPRKGIRVDCLIPMIHGTLGEDGAPQGLFEMLAIPYVGSGILSSAICMNKHVTKQLLRAAGIKTMDWVAVTLENRHLFNFTRVTEALGPILFVKPANLGSSVGMNKVSNENQFHAALEEAFSYSELILIESFVKGREIECAVLGNSNELVECSIPGEIIPHEDFYSYAAKYVEPEGKGATLVTPAVLDPHLVENFRQIAISAFKVLQCQGMARVDFFLIEKEGQSEIILNEVNTLPGFTNISMYPRLWQHGGVSYPALLNKLINLALDYHQRQQALTRIYRCQQPEPIKNNIVQ